MGHLSTSNESRYSAVSLKTGTLSTGADLHTESGKMELRDAFRQRRDLSRITKLQVGDAFKFTVAYMRWAEACHHIGYEEPVARRVRARDRTPACISGAFNSHVRTKKAKAGKRNART